MVLTEITCSPTPGAFRTTSGTIPELVRSSRCSRWGLGIIKQATDGRFWAFRWREWMKWWMNETPNLALLMSQLLPSRTRARSQRRPSSKSPKRSLGCPRHHCFSFLQPEAMPMTGVGGLTDQEKSKLPCRPGNITTWRISCSMYSPHSWLPFMFIIKSCVACCMLCVLDRPSPNHEPVSPGRKGPVLSPTLFTLAVPGRYTGLAP